MGGELRQRERFTASPYPAGVVRATGRRIETRPKQIRWIGLKAQALGATLDADLEMHFLHGGCGGLGGCSGPSSIAERVRFFRNWETAANGSGDPGFL